MADRDWERLAEFARERRDELGLTQEDVRAAGGPSTASIRLIEGALQHAYQPATLRDLERALQWERGSVARILAGGDPVPGVTIQLPPAIAPPRRPPDDGPPLPPATPPPRRNRRLPFLDAADEAGLAPFLLSVRRDLLAAAGLQFGPGREVPELPEVEEHLASLAGSAIFRRPHEVEIWNSNLLSTQEKQRLIALLRRLGAEAAEGPGEANAV